MITNSETRRPNFFADLKNDLPDELFLVDDHEVLLLVRQESHLDLHVLLFCKVFKRLFLDVVEIEPV